jgi:O-acetylhomoserine/O-acetylserine sulfhydrylase-like pyridoxal-dependent enzyme
MQVPFPHEEATKIVKYLKEHTKVGGWRYLIVEQEPLEDQAEEIGLILEIEKVEKPFQYLDI